MNFLNTAERKVVIAECEEFKWDELDWKTMSNDELIEFHMIMHKPPAYDAKYGDSQACICGHVYYRHFDSYEEMSPVGCKYCGCTAHVQAHCSECNGHLEQCSKSFGEHDLVRFVQCIRCGLKGPEKSCRTSEALKNFYEEHGYPKGPVLPCECGAIAMIEYGEVRCLDHVCPHRFKGETTEDSIKTWNDHMQQFWKGCKNK